MNLSVHPHWSRMPKWSSLRLDLAFASGSFLLAQVIPRKIPSGGGIITTRGILNLTVPAIFLSYSTSNFKNAIVASPCWSFGQPPFTPEPWQTTGSKPRASRKPRSKANTVEMRWPRPKRVDCLTPTMSICTVPSRPVILR